MLAKSVLSPSPEPGERETESPRAEHGAPPSPDWDSRPANSRVFTLGFRIKKLGLEV